MQYMIVEAKSAAALQKEVQKLIAERWQPQGGVAVASESIASGWWYYQALTRPAGD